MSIISRAINYVLGRAKYSMTGRTMVGGLPSYPDNNVNTYIDEGFSGNASLFSIIRTAAGKFGSIPVYVFEVANKTASKQYKNASKGQLNSAALYQSKKLFIKAYKEDEVINDLSKLLIKPNQNEGQDSFFEKVYSFKLVTGNALIWLNRGVDYEAYKTGPYEFNEDALKKIAPVEMYCLPTQYVEIITDPDDVFGISGYIFNISGERIILPKCDIIHWKSTSLDFDKFTASHLWGMSPLHAGLKTLTQDQASNDAAVAMYQNGGAKGVIFEKSLAKMSTEQLAKLDNVIDKRINNTDMKGAVVRMQGDYGYVNLGLSSTDMQLLDAQELSMKKLCRLFGVPYELFESETTFANKETAWKFFILNTILPAWCSLRDELNRQLVPSFNLANNTIDIDYSNLPELQEDMAKQVTALSGAWWFTPNEKREMMFEETDESVPEMDMYLIPSNLIPITDVGMSAVDNVLNNGGGSNADLSNNA